MKNDLFRTQIYVCDDEPKIAEDLSAKIKAYMPQDVVVSISGGAQLLKRLWQEPCDILFLDIDMPDVNGMDIAGKLAELEHKPLLVFVTGHDELVYESLQYHPFGFIRKSYFDEEIEKVLRDCEKELGERQKHFHFRMGSRDVSLLLSDILYFEADGNYLKLYTAAETFRLRSTVTAVENSLGGSGFIRVHKGFLVNQSAVRIIGRNELEMTNGSFLSFGKNYMEGAKRKLLRYMRL